MSRNYVFAPGEYYHLYLRGVEKRDVFLGEDDYLRFMRMLFLCNSNRPVVYKTVQGLTLDEVQRGEEKVAIGAYCLMPNHFHILVYEVEEKGVSSFMQKLMTGYSMYFNEKYERTGRLFEGSYRAKHISSDEYLKYLYSYIHLNPIALIEPRWRENGVRDKERAFRFLETYQYSSFVDYIGTKREGGMILNSGMFPEYFQTAAEHYQELEDWLTTA